MAHSPWMPQETHPLATCMQTDRQPNKNNGTPCHSSGMNAQCTEEISTPTRTARLALSVAVPTPKLQSHRGMGLLLPDASPSLCCPITQAAFAVTALHSHHLYPLLTGGTTHAVPSAPTTSWHCVIHSVSVRSQDTSEAGSSHRHSRVVPELASPSIGLPLLLPLHHMDPLLADDTHTHPTLSPSFIH